jgi:flagellar hook-associated protein 2
MASIASTSSTGSVNFSGLASGLDTTKIIEQLMEVESKPLKRLEDRQTDLTNKKDAYTSIKSDLLSLKTSVSDLRNSSAFSVFSASSSDEEALTLSALPSAREGNYRIKIRSLAQAKALSGNSYTASDTPIGLSGELLLNGKGFRVRVSDTLQDIANGINGLTNGINATILKVADNDNRLILSASSQGKQGFLIANAGGTDILGALGFTDGTRSIRETVNGAVRSASFSSATSTVGSIAGISSQAKGTVKIRNRSVSIDLAADTLSSIRDKINELGAQGVTAAVESSTENGSTVYRLTVTGTQDFTDDGNVLESLGILEGGTEGVKARLQTAALSTGNGKSDTTEKTKLSDLGAAAKNGGAETVTVTGTNTDGSTVSHTIQIGKNSTVSDLLSGIEAAFSGNVSATVENGHITIESVTGGESKLAVQLSANNESGGTLDFGAVSTVTQGRLRLLVEGTDAEILVNNTTVTRSTNEINDALTGLALTLKKADPDNEVILTVNRNTDAIKSKIEGFVKLYNELVDFIETNSQFDQEKKTAGALMGDTTSRTVLSRIRDTLRQTFGGDGFDYTQLFQVGIEFTSTGRLQINTEKLDQALKTDIDAVTRLFTVTRSSTDSDITFSYSSVKTKPGSYAVTITQAAEKATVSADAAFESAQNAGTITITDNIGSSMSVEVAQGDKPVDIANRINEEAAKTYEKIVQSANGLNRSDGSPITQNTAIGDIAGVNVGEGDTITVTATDHSGRSYQRRLVLTGPQSHTIQDILTAIEKMTDNNASASIDTEGRIQVQDKDAGASKLAVTIASTVNGLDFGAFSTLIEGRNTVSVEASASDDNRLVLTQTGYGSGNTFTVSGGAVAGIADGTYRGKDVAGTINGVAGTGNGQSLTASSSDASSVGITTRVTLTPEDLAAEGSSQGTITLVSGAADALYREISTLTDIVNGFVQAKIDSFSRSISTTTSDINKMNKRLDLRKQMYVMKFAALEKSLSLLQGTQQKLSATLAALPTPSL